MRELNGNGFDIRFDGRFDRCGSCYSRDLARLSIQRINYRFSSSTLIDHATTDFAHIFVFVTHSHRLVYRLSIYIYISLSTSLRLSVCILIHFGTALSLVLCPLSVITEAEPHRQSRRTLISNRRFAISIVNDYCSCNN